MTVGARPRGATYFYMSELVWPQSVRGRRRRVGHAAPSSRRAASRALPVCRLVGSPRRGAAVFAASRWRARGARASMPERPTCARRSGRRAGRTRSRAPLVGGRSARARKQRTTTYGGGGDDAGYEIISNMVTHRPCDPSPVAIIDPFLLPLDAGCRMPDVGFRMPDAGCQMPDVGFQMPDARCQMQDHGTRPPGRELFLS